MKQNNSADPGSSFSLTAEQAQLYQNIKKYKIDDATASYSFTERLAKENGWTILFAIRAVEEYKKFMFLICLADHPLTPSDQVDQVWHLHLLYTRSYWEEFCGEILARKVHHGPTKGGEQEAAKFNDWYQKTKTLYEQVFQQVPPMDIWPQPANRFKRTHFQRVSLDEYWIIKKIKF
ncbi:hypothetical protein [Cesiribacter sp. SM1]|uniref:glycine-rich domain-containing protein n=1 Tax=Cesiribacter sp. SM1 TaxID=2861196 RepID=UPI001CD5756A|nr:hypothetical protein [Cesiribacter sp. SM1]